MTDEPTKPTEADGPLMGAAYEHADAIDRAKEPGERRRAWTRFLPAAVAAFVESWAREGGLFVAALLSVIAVIAGATADGAGWVAAGVVSGVAGLVLVLWAAIRRWSFGRQWLTILVVIAWQVAVLMVFELYNI